jgi:hypothetical protein
VVADHPRPFHAPIRFTAPDGTPLHSPMVEAEIGGVSTRLVLDTGSDTHLLTAEFAEAAGLAVEPGEAGMDHAGTEIESGTAGTVPIRIGEDTLALHSVVVIPAPPPFPGWGIGGIVSPQFLHPTAWIVIDMADDALVFAETDEAELMSRLTSRHPDWPILVLDRIEDGTTVVQAAIEPHPPIPTLINTGGKSTEFARAAIPDRLGGQSVRLGGGVSGADVMGTRLGPAVLAIGGMRIPVADLTSRDEMDGVQGMVGMDVLRGTILACTAHPAGRVIWQVALVPF